MTKHKVKTQRDLEKVYSKKEFVDKLRRLADFIEQNERFRIQITSRDTTRFNLIHQINHFHHPLMLAIVW